MIGRSRKLQVLARTAVHSHCVEGRSLLNVNDAISNSKFEPIAVQEQTLILIRASLGALTSTRLLL